MVDDAESWRSRKQSSNQVKKSGQETTSESFTAPFFKGHFPTYDYFLITKKFVLNGNQNEFRK